MTIVIEPAGISALTNVHVTFVPAVRLIETSLAARLTAAVPAGRHVMPETVHCANWSSVKTYVPAVRLENVLLLENAGVPSGSVASSYRPNDALQFPGPAPRKLKSCVWSG